DLADDDALDRGAAEAVGQGLTEGVVEVGADGALRVRARERVARAALGNEELLAGDDVVVASDGVLAAARDGHHERGGGGERDGGAREGLRHRGATYNSRQSARLREVVEATARRRQQAARDARPREALACRP